ncbi:glutathione S-transferase [Testicularia cyperi]|uniref:Glutathione S-transferase n=1 Tax=Testicularia cyperi TaxID=1882483 RepID=A0A317Y103_9BASI|nr:glutathione S-transferase [Testicularia cyperi]
MTDAKQPSRVLYYLQDSRAFRVAWALEELELEWELKQYMRVEGKRAVPEMKLESGNPYGKSPWLVDGDVELGESAAIVRYLVERYGPQRGKADLLGKAGDWQSKGLVDAFASFSEAAMIHTLVPVYSRWFTDTSTSLSVEKNMSANIHNNLDHLERTLSSNLEQYGPTNGPDAAFLVGDSITAADILTAFTAEYTFGMDTAISSLGKKKEDWPNTVNWLKALAQRPAYQRVKAKGAIHKFTIE